MAKWPWIVAVVAALVAPTILTIVALTADVTKTDDHRGEFIVVGTVGESYDSPGPPNPPEGYIGFDERIWRFHVERIERVGQRGEMAVGDDLEVMLEPYQKAYDDFEDGGRLTVLLYGYEKHDPDTQVNYFEGWSASDARSGPFWTANRHHLEGAAGLLVVNLAAACALAFQHGCVPLKRGEVALLVAAVAAILFVIVFGMYTSSSLFYSDGEENYGANIIVFPVFVAAAWLAAVLPRFGRGAASILCALVVLMAPILAVPLSNEGGLGGAWLQTVVLCGAFAVLAWLFLIPGRIAGVVWIVAAGAGLAFAAFLFVVAPYQGPLAGLSAIMLWGPPALLGALALSHGVGLVRRRKPAPPPFVPPGRITRLPAGVVPVAERTRGPPPKRP